MAEGEVLQGSLRETALSDVLKTIEKGALTGSLRVVRGEDEKRIAILQGKPAFAASNNPDEGLGEQLLRTGRISLLQYEEARKAATETGRRFGTVLCERQFITAEELFQGVQLQVEQIILDLFAWTWGEFRFEPAQELSGEFPDLPLSLNQLIFDGLQGTADWSRIVNGLGGSVEGVFDKSLQGDSILYEMEIPEDTAQIFSLVNGKITARQMCALSYQNEFDTLKSLWALQAIGAIFLLDQPRREQPEAAVSEEELEGLLERYNEFLIMTYDFVYEHLAELVDHVVSRSLNGLPLDLKEAAANLNLRNRSRIEFEEMMAAISKVEDQRRRQVMVRLLNELLRSILTTTVLELGREETDRLLNDLRTLGEKHPGIPIGLLTNL